MTLNAGFICLNGLDGFDLSVQREVFAEALTEIDEFGDLINQALEVTLNEDRSLVEIIRYDLPRE